MLNNTYLSPHLKLDGQEYLAGSGSKIRPLLPIVRRKSKKNTILKSQS